MMNKLTSLEIDALKELVNIGGGHAATSISVLIDKPVEMIVPLIKVMNYEELYKDIMAESEIIYAVTIQVSSKGEGMFLFALPESSASEICDMMLPPDFEKSEEMIGSAITELSNILVNSFMNSIGQMLEIEFHTSEPGLTIDMFGSIISSLYMVFDQFDDEVLIIENEFYYSGKKMDALLYFIPEVGVLENLFKSIGM
ncbi:chemotaxis protein CheC [Vagococcus hydrophili]|uniref:Chemotaxis protein CheC n=1 Tax=Vagococcus hydrophili TaxID=2714947 RepID=A0A6G8AWD7_9ENTE|nr:chemotaxis protein CheC [Vagococcus hydrophili]QIL49327.1 chemotaxis protein CheC [Vagococcus hydrophili]